METITYDPKEDAFVRVEEGDHADLEQAQALAGIAKIQVMGIPLGNAAVGGGIAFLVDSVTERFLPQISGPLANLIGAFAIVYFGKRFLGTSTAQAAAMFLTYEAMRDWIEGALGGIFGAAQHNPGGLGQMPATTGTYYEPMLRR